MKMQILLDQRNGNLWDVSMMVESFSWSTKRIGSASSIDLTMIQTDAGNPVNIKNGNVLRVTVNDVPLFYGFVFEVEQNLSSKVKVKAYDQIRYLMATDTYRFSGVTASQVIQRIANDLKLRVGMLENTQHVLPAFVEDNKKLMDIICLALDRTLVATGRNFVFYDDFGSLRLRNMSEWVVEQLIGDFSLMTDLSLNRSIDKETYNAIKLLQKNKKTGRRDAYLAQDSANIARWGKLQLTEVVDEKLNAAQIKQRLDQLIRLKNRETKSISLDALGNLQVRAGCYVPLKVSSLGLNQYFLVEECTHSFSNGTHKMSLDLKVIG